MEIEIRELHNDDQRISCARLMCNSEPWITLGRTYEESLKILGDPSKEVYLAHSNNESAGFIIINMNGPFTGYIQTICIVPEYRGKGIGSILIKFAEERIFRESPNVFMCVSSFNTEARRLYERLGYEIIGELKDYLVQGYAEILLRKTIGPISKFKPS
jgi:[ribosomal protein S18]-alanine N-acetyltransferase